MPSGYIHTGEVTKTRTYKELAGLGALPRCSEISKILPKPQLERWKITKALELGSIEAMEDYVSTKADGGTDIHEFIENIELGKIRHPRIADTVCDHILNQYRELIHDLAFDGWENWLTEETIINTDLGYAGRTDKIMKRGDSEILVMDWKTQDVKNNKPEFYETFVFQQSAYGMAQKYDIEQVRCTTVVIDRSTGQFYPKQWLPREVVDGWKAFNYCHWLYCYTNGYEVQLALKNFKRNRDAANLNSPTTAVVAP